MLLTLTAEWKRREEERELLLQKKVAEYSDMERHLRNLITQMERRERELVVKEQQV